jgi:hypothetical protein
MKYLQNGLGGETKASPCLRHIAFGLIVASLVIVVLTMFGHARIHASLSSAGQSGAKNGAEQAPLAIAFHTKASVRDGTSRPTAEATPADPVVVLHGALDGNLHPVENTPSWRHWLQ